MKNIESTEIFFIFFEFSANIDVAWIFWVVDGVLRNEDGAQLVDEKMFILVSKIENVSHQLTVSVLFMLSFDA